MPVPVCLKTLNTFSLNHLKPMNHQETQTQHLRRLRELEARLGLCQSSEAEAAVQALIDAENQRWADYLPVQAVPAAPVIIQPAASAKTGRAKASAANSVVPGHARELKAELRELQRQDRSARAACRATLRQIHRTRTQLDREAVVAERSLLQQTQRLARRCAILEGRLA
jgi:hypothetical protein